MNRFNLTFGHLLSLLIGLFFVLSSNNSFSQGINIFDIDTTNYPIIKAKFYAYDKDGKIQRPTKDQLKIIENGTERKIIDVSCPIKQPIAISSVLTFDVSGSMSSGPNGVANLDLAKTAAKSWIAALPTKESQAAITSFNNNNYIIQDFTRDNNKLLVAIEKLKPQGGTDYNQGFIEPMGGGILMAKTGKYKRVLIFLTDGQPNFEPDVQKIINEAKINNITIFAVTLGMTCPQNLKDISLQTDGYWYENITSLQEAKKVYLEIMRRVQDDPCDISWESGLSCDFGNINLEIKYQNLSQSIDYRSPQNSIFSLEFNPKYNVVFRNKEVGKSYDTIITIKAINSDVEINNIISTNPQFQINPKSIKLLKNESKNITITYTPIDEKYKFTKFEFINDICLQNFFASSFNTNVKNNSLKLTHPNGSEIFLAGTDTFITWEGISEKDICKIEFSNDSSKSWKTLTSNASNLKYKWKNIPKPINNQSLIKISQKQKDSDTSNFQNGNLELTLGGGHRGEVNDISWSPDGSKVATASSDYTGKLWDVNTGILLYTLTGHRAYVTHISWSPDGSKVATSSSDKTCKIWDTDTGKLLNTLSGHSSDVNDFSWSPDGSRVATASWDNTGKIWDANTGKLLNTLIGHTYWVWHISWSPDGSRVATASVDKTGKIWDANTGTLLNTLIGHSSDVFHISWSPDGSRVATASVDGTGKIWDANTGKLFNTLTGHSSGINHISWSPDGSKVATAGYDGTGKIWDANTLKLLNTLKRHDGYVFNISWSPDGSKVATANEDGTGEIWDANTSTLINTLIGHTNSVPQISWSPDGSKVATASWDYTGKLWDVNTGILLYTLTGHKHYVNHISWSPDGNKVATASYDNTGKIWDANTGILNYDLTEHSSDVFQISWSPDGSKLATASSDGTSKLWDSNTGILLNTLSGISGDSVTHISWSPDGSKIAIASGDKTGKIWDANTGILLITLKGHTEGLTQISWNPDGSKVATASIDKTGKIWDANTGSLLNTLTGHIDNVTHISWNPDGSKVATASWDKAGKIWDANTGTLLKTLTLTGNNFYVTHISWSPDGSRVTTASSDQTGKIWDANSGTLLFTLTGHSSYVFHISWSPDGSRVATASADGTGKIWDANSGTLINTLIGHTNTVPQISWSPDGIKVATASYDLTAKIWHIGLSPIQSDQSDAVFSIVAPEVKARDIDMKRQLVGTVMDSVVVGFIENIGTYKCRIDSIYFEGEQFDEFQVVSGIPVFTVDVSKNYNVEFRFKPKAVGIRKSTIVIITQADTLRYKITGEGIQPMVQVLNNFIDFGKVNVKENKDSLQAKTIKNVGSADLKITKIYQYGPNLTDFTEITPLQSTTLKPNEELKMDLRFTPKYQGRTSGTLMFEYEGIGSPAVVQLFGEGISNNPNCDGRGFVFDNFHSKSNLQLVGSAELTQDSTVRLTDTKSNLVGGVTYGERLALRSSFEMFFSFRMSNGDNNQFIDGSLPGADGFAVLFQNGKNFRTTANGGSLGFNGIENCVALEIDMYKNDNDFFDPNGNHVALQVPKDNIITAEHSAARTVAMNDQIFELRQDSTVYYGKLVYDADKKQIQFFLDSTNKYNNLVLTAENFDFSQYLQLELGDFAHIGITSTTGAATQIHELLSWEFCSERDEFLSVEDRYYESDEVKQIDNILKLDTGNIKEIEVMDITGKVLINKDINNNEINLNELNISTGIYFIILKDDQNRSHFRKVNVVR